VANAHMAAAIRSISVARGYDVRDYVLVAFGGAAPQHACAVARELGISQVLNHPDGGVLSAYGIGLADVTRNAVEGIYRRFDDDALQLVDDTFARLTDSAVAEVEQEGIASDRISTQCSLDLRYVGVDAFLNIDQPADDDWLAAYERQHRQLYGYVHEGRPVEIVAARVEAIGSGGHAPPKSERMPARDLPAHNAASVYFDGQFQEAVVIDRAELRGGERIEGPAIVLDDVSTTIIDPGWSAEVLSGGVMLLTDDFSVRRTSTSVDHRTGVAGVERSEPPVPDQPGARSARPQPPADHSPAPAMDPILLEVFNNHFTAIATQMGETLRNTSSSVNVKERLDFSCALFTAAGDLVVNAPHIPVHLGAMGETVRRVIADNPDMAAGDSYVTNDPYRGGSHLPDVTVVTPVHDAGGRLLFFTASRAHHAEIGGITPGSMPPFSKNLAEEGVLIRNFKLIDGGRSRLEALERLLASAEYPSRAVADNLADISAQLAANRQGARDLRSMVERYSLPVVQAYMAYIQQAAETKTRAALARLPDGVREFRDQLDDGAPVNVQLEISGDEAVIDFTGTGRVMPGNLNANRAIVTAAVLYCLRLLIDEDIPLNQGVLAPVEIVLPECLPAESARARIARRVCRGCRRQCGNVAARGRLPARRIGSGGGQPGDDEQHPVRQRAVWLLRNGLRRIGGDRRCCRRVGGAYAHDQHAVN